MGSWKDSIKDLAHGNWSLGNWGRRSRSDDSNPVSSLQRQMNSLFDEFFSGWGSNEWFSSRSFIPKLNMSEDDEKVFVSVELPGMEQKDIELTLTQDALTIRGEKKEESEQKDNKNYYTMERSYGMFQRSIPLNCEIDTDKVDAVFKNGILSITLTKTPEAKARAKRITIRS